MFESEAQQVLNSLKRRGWLRLRKRGHNNCNGVNCGYSLILLVYNDKTGRFFAKFANKSEFDSVAKWEPVAEAQVLNILEKHISWL